MAVVSEPTNPGGRMGFGAVIRGEKGDLKVYDGARAAAGNTNNVAEYCALELALDWLIENGHTLEPISVMGDSQLVINQCFGRWRIKSGAYAEVARRVQSKLRRFSAIRGKWVPRDQNELADELSKMHLRDAGVEIADRTTAHLPAKPAPKSESGRVVWGEDNWDAIEAMSDIRWAK